MKYVYTVWFLNPMFPKGDQDREWPASMIIDGSTCADARKWGDYMANAYAVRTEQYVLSSTIEVLERSTLPGLDQLPVICQGEEASDEKIGW